MMLFNHHIETFPLLYDYWGGLKTTRMWDDVKRHVLLRRLEGQRAGDEIDDASRSKCTEAGPALRPEDHACKGQASVLECAEWAIELPAWGLRYTELCDLLLDMLHNWRDICQAEILSWMLWEVGRMLYLSEWAYRILLQCFWNWWCFMPGGIILKHFAHSNANPNSLEGRSSPTKHCLTNANPSLNQSLKQSSGAWK